MRRGAVLAGLLAFGALAVVSLIALGRTASAGAADETASRATEAAARAEARVARLEERLDDLQGRVGSLEAHDARTTTILERLAQRLDRSVGDLRSALRTAADAADRSDAAEANAASALTQAQEAARAIAVLEERLNYHLRNGGR